MEKNCYGNRALLGATPTPKFIKSLQMKINRHFCSCAITYRNQKLFLHTKEAEFHEENSDRNRHLGTDERPIFEDKKY